MDAVPTGAGRLCSWVLQHALAAEKPTSVGGRSPRRIRTGSCPVLARATLDPRMRGRGGYDHGQGDVGRAGWYGSASEGFGMRTMILAVAVSAVAWAAWAEPPGTVEDDLGILNPQDTGREMLTRKIEMGVIDSITCSLGINVTKNDNFELARKLTRRCAEAGYAKAMTWMSQLENNGLGGDYNPDASAEWDRRAAEAGDPVGQFNHGMNLLRGH
ncbi:MAG: hypothetical protein AAGG06_20180, partial [Pseudomonadota bacterium]